MALALLALAVGVLAVSLLWPGNSLAVFPSDAILQPAGPISAGFRHVARDWTIGGVEFGALVRGLADYIELPMRVLNGFLDKGVTLPLPGASVVLPALPWAAFVILVGGFAFWAGGLRLAALIVGSCAFLLVFGLWSSAMLTLTAVAVAVVCSTLLGLFLGVRAHRSPRLARALTLVYDALQTMPVFSYLVPLLVFLGVGPATALVATIIFATPPMARVTMTALQGAPQSTADLARIIGCSERAAICRVILPAQRETLLVGLNQVIMLSLAMVVIASLIGAGGLGVDVLKALRSLRLGEALVAGLGITLIALSLDRLSVAVAHRRPHHGEPRWGLVALYGAAVIVVCISAALVPELARFPKDWVHTPSSALGDGVKWLNVAYGAELGLFRDTLTIWVLRPVRDLLTGLPWATTVLFFGALLSWSHGWRVAVVMMAALTLVAACGLWAPAMTSLYIVLLGSTLAVVIGFPIGVAAERWPRCGAVVGVTIDTLQTLPSFVYLIPVVVLFSVGEFAALLAIAAYALAPVIRYTWRGLAGVDTSVIEAARMMGSTERQLLLQVKLPMALPMILLGINQTIMLAFGMLVITALVGSRGLELATLEALSRVDVGRGLVAGIGIVILTIAVDRVVLGLARRAGPFAA
jgi:glycine betaine/proline transport system permease protein